MSDSVGQGPLNALIVPCRLTGTGGGTGAAPVTVTLLASRPRLSPVLLAVMASTSPLLRSTQFLPLNVVDALVRTYVPLTSIESVGHGPLKVPSVPVTVTVLVDGGVGVEADAVTTIFAARTVLSLCLVPATPIESPFLRSAQFFPVNVVALSVRT